MDVPALQKAGIFCGFFVNTCGIFAGIIAKGGIFWLVFCGFKQTISAGGAKAGRRPKYAAG